MRTWRPITTRLELWAVKNSCVGVRFVWNNQVLYLLIPQDSIARYNYRCFSIHIRSPALLE